MGEPALSIVSRTERADRMGLPPRARLALNDATIRRALERIADLSALEEQLLFRLCCLSLLQGYAWIGQAALAELLRCSERTLRDITKDVSARGLLVTVRMRDGLRYFPQWEALGLCPESRSGPANPAGSDRQILPMHLGSTKGSNKTDSSRARGRAPEPQAAAFSFEVPRETEPPQPERLPEPVIELPELGAVLDKFGPEADRDVRDVLRTRAVREQPAAGHAALERLLRMDVGEIRTSPGACFRNYVQLALEGRLAPTSPERRPSLPPPSPAQPALPAEAIAELRQRRREVKDMLERVWLDREKATPLRAELADIDAQLPPRFVAVPAHVPYVHRDGPTGKTMTEAIAKLRHAPPQVIAVAARQLQAQEALEVVTAHAPAHPAFVAAVVAELDHEIALSAVRQLQSHHALALLAALREVDEAVAGRLESTLANTTGSA